MTAIRRKGSDARACRTPLSPPGAMRAATSPQVGGEESLTNEQMFVSLCPPPLLACVLLPEARPKGSPRNRQISWGNKGKDAGTAARTRHQHNSGPLRQPGAAEGGGVAAPAALAERHPARSPERNRR